MGKNIARLLPAVCTPSEWRLDCRRLLSKLACYLVLATPVLVACSIEPLTEDEEWERDNRRQIDRENWAMCEHVLPVVVHFDHMEKDHRHHNWIRADLLNNNCRMVLRDRWQRY